VPQFPPGHAPVAQPCGPQVSQLAAETVPSLIRTTPSSAPAVEAAANQAAARAANHVRHVVRIADILEFKTVKVTVLEVHEPESQQSFRSLVNDRGGTRPRLSIAGRPGSAR
jgi:hypothetical protein